MAELIFGDLRLLEQSIEQRLALPLVHILDRDRELRVDEQDLAAGHRVDAHHRMNRWRVQRLPAHHVLPIFLGIVKELAERLEVVDRFKAGDELLHAVAEALEGRRHAGEHRIATDRRYFLGDEDRGLRGFFAERLIRVPDVGAERRVGLVVAELDQYRDVFVAWCERMHR